MLILIFSEKFTKKKEKQDKKEIFSFL